MGPLPEFTGRFIRSQASLLFRARHGGRDSTHEVQVQPVPVRCPPHAEAARSITARASCPLLGSTSLEVLAPFSATCFASPFLRASGSRLELRPRACLPRDLSASSVSHALDGFLLATHRRSVSPGRHSWDFRPSEPSPLVQPQRLSASVALLTLLPASRPVSRLQGLAPRESPLVPSGVSAGLVTPLLSWASAPPGHSPFPPWRYPSAAPPLRRRLDIRHAERAGASGWASQGAPSLAT